MNAAQSPWGWPVASVNVSVISVVSYRRDSGEEIGEGEEEEEEKEEEEEEEEERQRQRETERDRETEAECSCVPFQAFG